MLFHVGFEFISFSVNETAGKGKAPSVLKLEGGLRIQLQQCSTLYVLTLTQESGHAGPSRELNGRWV